MNRPPGRLGPISVYVLGTGATIGAGFFVLPGIAAAQAGAAIVLAYLLAGLAIVPALSSKAELATAMPKASGTHDYLDRTLGPMGGTIGGVATWLGFVLKAGLALIGLGAYLALIVDLPVRPVAAGLALAIAAGAAINSGDGWRLTRWLVPAVLTVLFIFIVSGLTRAAGHAGAVQPFESITANSFTGMLSVVSLVFVSYVGLTRVAGRTERLERPGRDLALGMGLALATLMTLYVAGAYVMVVVLGTDGLAGSLTPVAAAADAVMGWLPAGTGTWIVVGAAIASLGTVANSGMRAASVYPIALAKDSLFPDPLSLLDGKHARFASIGFVTLLVLVIVFLDIATVARMTGALQLLLFGLLHVAVMVVRESRGDSSTAQQFRSPLYPWLQLAGIFVSLVLIAEMGWVTVLFTVAVTAGSFGWYNYYGRKRVRRDGAIVHVIERLGRRRIMGMDRELRELVRDRVIPPADTVVEESFDEVVARALVIDRTDDTPLSRFIRDASAQLAPRVGTSQDRLRNLLIAGLVGAPVARGAALLHARVPNVAGSELLIARCARAVHFDVKELQLTADPDPPVHALFFLVSNEKAAGRHLRILAKLAGRVEDSTFMRRWLDGESEADLKATLREDG